jgi:hypothetical protein
MSAHENACAEGLFGIEVGVNLAKLCHLYRLPPF